MFYKGAAGLFFPAVCSIFHPCSTNYSCFRWSRDQYSALTQTRPTHFRMTDTAAGRLGSYGLKKEKEKHGTVDSYNAIRQSSTVLKEQSRAC